jgi:hypothetical protein
MQNEVLSTLLGLEPRKGKEQEKEKERKWKARDRDIRKPNLVFERLDDDLAGSVEHSKAVARHPHGTFA